MMRSRPNPASIEEPLDPAIQAELDQLDAALRGEPIEDDVLAAIVRDVQASTPEMPADLRKQLRHDVSSGFAREGLRGRFSAALGRTDRHRRTPGAARRPSLAFGGGIAVTVIVLASVVATVGLTQFGSSGGTYSDTSSSVPLSAESSPATMSAEPPSAAVPEIDEGSAGGGGSTATGLSPQQRALVDKTLQSQPSAATSQSGAVARGTSSTPATGQRRVEQAVDMTVRVKSGQLDESTARVEDIVRQGGGYVQDSRVSIRTRGAGTATFTLKVATSKLDQTLQRLADLGTVTSQQQASRDITSSFDSVNQRLDDNKQVRAALLRSLAKAETDGQIASLNRRLADNRRSRASLESQLARLRTRANLTTIDLAIRAPSGDAPSTDDDGNWSIGDAASDAAGALGTVTGVLLVGAAVLLPFAILGGIGWVLYRVRRKRSRESALD